MREGLKGSQVFLKRNWFWLFWIFLNISACLLYWVDYLFKIFIYHISSSIAGPVLFSAITALSVFYSALNILRQEGKKRS